MSFFRIQNVYLKKTDDALNIESEFKINFNVFNTKLLKLQQNLKKLNLKKMQHNLTNATIT